MLGFLFFREMNTWYYWHTVDLSCHKTKMITTTQIVDLLANSVADAKVQNRVQELTQLGVGHAGDPLSIGSA